MNTIHKKILNNGLTVLVNPVTYVPKVSVQLWYNVGSAHEKDGERGLAHLLEHMIFKGTKRLSESDINVITQNLSGYCNAFTSYDYTGYIFDFPKQHWTTALDILSDCMSNCTFDEQMLNSEVKAVVQELKMYRDDYQSTLMEELFSHMFIGHPYHHPIIGYKHNLWDINQEALLRFYHKHYIPNNGVLAVVGDVDFAQVFEYADEYFGAIPADLTYKKNKIFYQPDTLTHGITLSRDVQLPIFMLSWRIPGTKENQGYLIELVRWILAEGKGSRLYKKLVDELDLATDVNSCIFDMHEYGVLFLQIDPLRTESINTIKKVVMEELEKLAQEIAHAEIERAVLQAHMEYVSLIEHNQKRAHIISQLYLSTGDEQTFLSYDVLKNDPLLSQKIKEFFKSYLKPNATNEGKVLPIDQTDLAYWEKLQKNEDEMDQKIMTARERSLPVIAAVHASCVAIKAPSPTLFPVMNVAQLKNGLKIRWANRPGSQKVECILEFQARNYHDPSGQEGISSMMSHLLLEGTERLPGSALSDAFERRGISCQIGPGSILLSMRVEDIEYALGLVNQMVTKATFEEDAIEQIRAQQLADIADFWDTPTEYIGQLAKEHIYGKHPYHKNSLGSEHTVQQISRDQLVAHYRSTITPVGAHLVFAGDLSCVEIEKVVTATLGNWCGAQGPLLHFPVLSLPQAATKDYQANRDQVAVCFAGLSVPRCHPDYDALLLFDQALSGSVLGSMSSYLFALREQTGLFYTIGGSLLAHADEQPGMMYIKTLVNADKVTHAQEAIGEVLATCIDRFTTQDLQTAYRALANTIVDSYETTAALADALLYIERFNLPQDYFSKRSETLAQISLEQVKTAARKIVNRDQFICIRVGRL